MAEVYYIHILPHCAIGPVAFAACRRVDAAVPNFAQEQVDACLGNGLLQEDWVVKDAISTYQPNPTCPFSTHDRIHRGTWWFLPPIGR